MATTITELNLIADSKVERPSWTLNVTSDDVSAATTIKAAVAGKKHFIEKLTVTYKSGGTNWFKVMDGTAELISSLILADGVPWTYAFLRPIYGTANTNLRIRTGASGNIHILIEGFTEA